MQLCTMYEQYTDTLETPGTRVYYTILTDCGANCYFSLIFFIFLYFYNFPFFIFIFPHLSSFYIFLFIIIHLFIVQSSLFYFVFSLYCFQLSYVIDTYFIFIFISKKFIIINTIIFFIMYSGTTKMSFFCLIFIFTNTTYRIILCPFHSYVIIYSLGDKPIINNTRLGG